MLVNPSMRRSILCHERYLATVLEDIETYENAMRKNIDLTRLRVTGIAQSWVDEWERLLQDRNCQKMKEICQGTNNYSQSMRQVSPFTGLLPL